MAKLKPYTKYKESGSSWIGSIPDHWDVKPLRAMLNQRNEKNDPIKTQQILSLSIAHGVTLYSHEGRGGNKSKDDLSAYKVAHEGDIVMNSMNVIVGAVGLSRYTGAISPVYYALYKKSMDVNIHYYEYIFKNPSFQRFLLTYGKGILIKKSGTGKLNTIRMKVSMGDLKMTGLPVPPTSEQDMISLYLDQKTKEINTYIRELKKQIKFLKEHRQKIISQAVTCGLDGNGKLRNKPEWNEGDAVPNGWKNSGVEWLGLIPEDWTLLRGKFLFRLQKREFEEDAGTVTVFRDGEVTLRENRRTSGFTNSLLEIGYQGVKKGDLVIHQMDAFAGAIGVSDSDGKCSPVCSVLSPSKQVSSYYYSFLLRHVAQTGWIKALSRGIRQRSTDFRYDMFANQYYCVPPIKLQTKIVNYIDKKLEEIDYQLVNVTKQIDFIKEYKQSLISKVVTGKIDVRNINNNLSED